ncbi:MAG: ferredoxin IV [Candidatus Woesearchaeota archaeon]|nr:MAG: ferredoxin IV [Candidatus Woesearchaeota archaeon]
MAILKTDTKEVELPDGSPTMNAAEELGVPFGCRQGVCGTCKVEVVEGMENLEPKTEREIELNLSPNERSMCQCKIKSGVVKIRF